MSTFNHAFSHLQQLGAQVFDRMYTVFTDNHIPKFNQEIQVWKSVAKVNIDPSKQPPPFTLLHKARELCQHLKTRDTWSKWPESSNVPRNNSCMEEITDMAALVV